MSQPKPADISIVQPPPLSTPLLPVSTIGTTVLPLELVDTLNHVFFLHILATDPRRVLPPGKSLLSVMSGPRSQAQRQDGELPALKDRVHDLVHRAFWDEVLSTLSDPSPASQMPRLKRLYEDLHVAVKPLVPSNHPIVITLSAPLSPTSAPLRSAILHLRELIACLRERCAPARDAALDALAQALDEPSSIAPTAELAKVVVDTARSILSVTEIMKEDLSQFVMGSMQEHELKAAVTQQAMLREKKLVLELWSPTSIEERWRAWVDYLQPQAFAGVDLAPRWVLRLVQSIGENTGVSCPLPAIPPRDDAPSGGHENQPTQPRNILPPPLFLTCPTLLAVQNYMQALVIAASLRSLVRLPPSSADSGASAEPSGPSFLQRIWTLLKAEIDEEPGAGDTKVVNLADEVIRVRRLYSACDAEEEARLRAAVDRTLQTSDPVFVLLHKRLLQALAAWVVRPPRDEQTQPVAPERLQTGRRSEDRPGKRPRLSLGSEGARTGSSWQRDRGPPSVVKGFEDEVLAKGIAETFGKVAQALDWTAHVWTDLIQSGEIRGVAADKAE